VRDIFLEKAVNAYPCLTVIKKGGMSARSHSSWSYSSASWNGSALAEVVDDLDGPVIVDVVGCCCIVNVGLVPYVQP